ncbi:MAG: AAA family ATPase [bacterium]|nr:AAA family ATPase [bacterium]
MFKCPFYTDNPADLDWDAISAAYPWIERMKTVEQDPIWHAEGNVWIHTRMVTEALIGLPEFHEESEQDRHILFWTALLHDVEKFSTTVLDDYSEDEKRPCVSAPRHAKRGEYTARDILYREHNCPFEIREQICKMVRWHGVPLWAMDKDNPQKTVLESSLYIKNRWLGMFAKADALGRKCHDLQDLLCRIEIFEEICKENKVWDSAYQFPSELGRFLYLYDESKTYPDYEPFDDYVGNVTMLCGLPGAGKSTYIKKRHPGTPVVSMDAIRRERKIKRGDKKAEGRMLQEIKEMAKEYMRKSTPFVWDATNITKNDRGKLIDLAMTYKYKVKIVYIEPDYNTLLQQNSEREYKVPESTIKGYLRGLEIPGPSEAYVVKYATPDVPKIKATH